jgi:hypothetical protein
MIGAHEPHGVLRRRLLLVGIFALSMLVRTHAAGAADAKFVSLAHGIGITGSPVDLGYAGSFNIDVGPPFDGPLTEA